MILILVEIKKMWLERVSEGAMISLVLSDFFVWTSWFCRYGSTVYDVRVLGYIQIISFGFILSLLEWYIHTVFAEN